MTSIGSNIASSSGAGSSGGALSPRKVSLSLKVQFLNLSRTIRKRWPDIKSIDAAFLKGVANILKELRIDPFRDIKSLLSLICDPDRLLLGTTPLHWAALMGDRIMVCYILSSGMVDINAMTTHWGETALSYAILGGKHEIVEDLLEHEANVFICTQFEESAFSFMVPQKDSMFDILKTILSDNVNVRDQGKRTALHYAAREGATDSVAYLLNEKADVNICDNLANTPLHYAVMEESLDVVKLLLQQNANVNALNVKGMSPLHIVARDGATNIIPLLMEHNVDIDVVDEDGCSPLIQSLRCGRVDTSNALIEAGANVYVKDKKDNNVLHLAIGAYGRENNMMDLVKLFCERNVDANFKNSKGYSPFFAAVVEGHTEVVKELLQNKEKIQLMEECNGQTTIQIAFDNDLEHIKRVLLECDDVSRYVETLYRDRQVYVDAANAILVGAALIASVTFASWLQPPLGYTTSYLDLTPSSSNIDYVDVQHNVSLRAFWIFNTLSFYFAIGTVVFGARSVLPRRYMFIKNIVGKLHQNLLVTSILLACSVFCVIVAFGIAGCIVLTPTLKFQWYMIVPTIFGGLVCLISLGFLFKSMVEDNLKKKRKVLCLY